MDWLGKNLETTKTLSGFGLLESGGMRDFEPDNDVDLRGI